jgi:hypothetical protein
MPLNGATTDENVGAARGSSDARAAIGHPEIAAGDSDSHFLSLFS